MIFSELHRRALRPGLLLSVSKACLSELWSSIQGGTGAATDPRQFSGLQIIQLGLAVCPLLWRCVQEVAADVEGERQESAVQIHHNLLLEHTGDICVVRGDRKHNTDTPLVLYILMTMD